MKLVMFDIDGALTQSVHADEVCFVQALREVFGFADIDTDWSTYPHCSDSGILEAIFQRRLGRSPVMDEVAAMQARFVSLLASSAVERPILPVAGAWEFISGLLAEGGWAVSLASGAWECSARLKLAGAGLEFPQIPAAFADDAQAREEIMLASLARAARARSSDACDAVIYFGDGIWDVRAASNLGYRFIGIAHEPAKIGRLHAEGARHVFPDYRDTAALMAVVNESHL